MLDDNAISEAKSLIEAYESGDEAGAKFHYDKLTSVSEKTLFSEVGKLTRELHDTLNSFQLDTRLTSLTETDLPDAKDRLAYVMRLTDDAANKTMDAVEKGIEISSMIKTEANRLNDGWQLVHGKQLDGKKFKKLCEDTQVYMKATAGNSIELDALLQDALMAQGFQDLTGQVITRVITLVKDVEASLVDTIKMFGTMTTEYEESAQPERKEKQGATGPTINPETATDVVSGQDEVDDLLSSLGF